MKDLPGRAQVIVVGGGIVGCSIAYHLTRLGVGDVLILERHQLTSGTTWHAAGLVAQLRSTENQTRLARYSHELYQRLAAETGQATGFQVPGAISLASTTERWEELRRSAAMARWLGVEASEIGPSEIGAMMPGLVTDDLFGGIWLPQDAAVSPTDTTMALAKGARQGGATVSEGVEVTRLIEHEGRCTGVVTAKGQHIEADTVVLACGLWTRHLAATAGVSLPLTAAEHHYVVTDPVPGLSGLGGTLPVVRDPDRWAYFKPESEGSMLLGLFEPIAKPWPASGPPPGDKPFVTITPDIDHIGTWLEPALARMPALQDVGLRLIFSGPESFTPDDSYILGEAPSLPGLFVAAGFNSIGIQSAGGAGMVLAQWIVDGHAPMDLADVDIRRFERFQGTERYLRERTVEGLGLLYASHWPHRQYDTARGIRRSPVHEPVVQAGACLGELNGWERPMFYARPELGVAAEWHDSWGRPRWHPAVAAEHLAVRERVGLFDQTSFSKFSVQGADAAAVLNRMSAADIAGDPGTSTYTQWCNPAGGIEADLTVSRIAEDEFWVIGGAGTRMRDLTAIRRAIAQHGAAPEGRAQHGSSHYSAPHYSASHYSARPAAATVTDLTSAYACLAVMGPRSREVLQPLTTADLAEEAFGFASHAEINLGSALVWANRMSYVGELGWELYVPTEFAVYVWDLVRESGEPVEMALCGYLALDSLRLERGYRHWGHELGPDESPVQAGLKFAVGWDKADDFVGRAALERHRAEGVTKRLVQVAVDDETVCLHHHEPLWRDGVRVGDLTSGAWGHTVGAAIGMGWAQDTEAITGSWVEKGSWEVEVAGARHAARVQLRPWLRRGP